MVARILSLLTLCLVLIAAPAEAATTGSAPVPEGSSVTLFAIGLAGLLLGRRLSSRKRDDSDKS